MLLAHLDVVEADVDAWERDPFDFIEEDGYFYGRGVSDDKDEAAIHVANLIRLKNASYTPSRDIVLVLTADEEGGEYNGVQWLLEKHPEKMWAKYVLSEGGGGVLIGGQHVVNEVQLAEKQYETLLIETDSPFLAPVPHRGKPCEPAFVTDTARLLSTELSWDIESLAAATSDNFFNLFTKAER